MGLFSRFEDSMEDAVEGAADKLSNAPISPVQIEKKAEKQMRREKMVGAGKQYAPTLYTILVNPDDDNRMFGYYPTLAGECETYLLAKAEEEGLIMDGHPLVRFVVDDSLKHGKFDVIAEAVAAPVVEQLRDEEMQRYGIAPRGGAFSQQGHGYQQNGYAGQQDPYQQPQRAPEAAPAADPRGQYQDQGQDYYDDYNDYADYNDAPEQQPRRKPPLPYVPEDEIDYSIDYGEYTFDSEDFEDYRRNSQRLGAHGVAAPASRQSQPLSADERAARAPQQMQPANTVAFTGGQGQPAAQTGRARMIDLAYQRTYDLAGTKITIGRESDNDIVVHDINASRHHAELALTPQGVWSITDLRSTNGTVVNGMLVASQPLYSGDRIIIGKTEFEFTQG